MLRRYGPPSVLKAEEFEPTQPGPGEVSIDVAFAGINFAELMQRVGLYQAAPRLPFVPGFELSGTVTGLGEGVEGVAIGDRVAAATRFGGYTSHATLPAEHLLALPKGTSLEDGAAFPVTYLTAHVALFEQARVRKGETVLVHGGAGGVGLAAIALARRHGCRVLATAGGPEKCAWLEREAGVEAAFDHRASGGWPAALGDSVGPVDCVLDGVGGRNLHQSLAAVGPLGRVVSFGGSEMIGQRRNLVRAAGLWARMHVAVPPLVRHSRGLSGLHVLHLWAEGFDLQGPAAEMLEAMAAGDLTPPRVDRVFDLEDAAAAHTYIHERRNRGKVLLKA